ncbi:alpha-amylase family glycosyl hydrolase [Pontibacter liquoris]|uniref:alpha-amylase family glycosyl hydrolase n=1 Tax=Pontibacter liquoris TaxID=2905677 RepID=UPI001FA74A86|nr:alpha-amylase family glycosyl hydrolase [Pontibacter liquoris]
MAKQHEEAMSPWPAHPVIYEINTLVWLTELSSKYNRTIQLATIPSEVWDEIAALKFDAVWLMGVWERSPAGIEIARHNTQLLADFKRALPGFDLKDIAGSPYCVRRYEVDAKLGGSAGLATARRMLRDRGIRLILDFVPNHVAPDHPWLTEHPAYFVQGTPDDARNDPASYIAKNGKVFARGRDPYFPAWPDVVQLNAFHTGLRQAAFETLLTITSQCDGVRCDMAMLVLNHIFMRTWPDRAGPEPPEEFWAVIRAVKALQPDFIFIAEAYWDLERELLQLGFDFCYDKRLYDRMAHQNADSVRQHLLGNRFFQDKSVRFIENHDEPRAASTFADGKGYAAATLMLTLPGAKLLHEGQLEGRNVRLPVFLGRRPEELTDSDLHAFYKRLLQAVGQDVFRTGQWVVCERSGWPDNTTYTQVLAWCWVKEEARYLVVINYSPEPAQALVQVPLPDLREKEWHLQDLLSAEAYFRNGSQMVEPGLYVAMAPWKSNVFRLEAL